MKLKSIFVILAFCCCYFLAQIPSFAQAAECDGILAGALQYSGQEYKLSSAMQQQLGKLKDQMLANPDCKVILSGHLGGSKFDQQLNWDRISTALDLMSEKYNIARNRFIFDAFTDAAPENEVVYRAAGPDENGPSTVAAPFPELRK